MDRFDRSIWERRLPAGFGHKTRSVVLDLPFVSIVPSVLIELPNCASWSAGFQPA